MNITVKQIEYKSSATGNTIFGWIYIPAERLAPRSKLFMVCRNIWSVIMS